MFTLGRPVDIYYRTNQLILTLTVVTITLVSFISNDITIGFKIAGIIFLTWAMSRELDPKREYGAFVSVGLVAYNFYIYFQVALDISFMEILFFMLILRLISTTCGKEPTTFDVGTIIAIASYLSYSLSSPIYLFLSLIGIYISGNLKDNRQLQKKFTGLVLGSTGYLLYRLFSQTSFKSPLFSIISFLTLIVLYLIHTFLDFKQETYIYDDTDKIIDPVKILKSQWFFVGSILLLVLFSNLAVGNFILYVSSLGGTVLYGIVARAINIEK